MKNFSGKISYFFITFLLGAIIISFALTGFQGFNSSSGAVANVDGTPVTIEEYNRALNSELNRYAQYFGGKSLSSKQIRQFRLKENVLNRLVQEKVMLNLAHRLELKTSTAEVKKEIKSAPFFQTNKQFDVNRYKSLLNANSLTPSKYEQLEKDRLSLVKLSKLFSSILVSKRSVEEEQRFLNSKAIVYAVSFDKESMTKHLPIPTEDVTNFAKDPKNEEVLKSLFNTLKSEFNKPEQVTARHILFNIKDGDEKAALKKATDLRKKLTPSNFASMAKKHTDEASGKKSGGDLGSFGKGRMVKEFEQMAFSMKPGTISKPVKTQFGYHLIYVSNKTKAVTKKFEDVKNTVALRHLRKTRRNELAKFNTKLKIDLKDMLAKNRFKELEKLSKKYNFKFVNRKEMNPLSMTIDGITFKEEEILPLFATKNVNTIIDNDEPTKVSLLKIERYFQDTTKTGELDKQVKTAQNNLIGKLNNELLKSLQEKAEVVTYPNLL